MMKKINIALGVISALLIASTSGPAADVRLHFIAVGHGDAILIEQVGRGCALVDAGYPEAGAKVVNYIRSLGTEQVDHLFATHTHDDHIGGLPTVLDSLKVGVIHHTGMLDDRESARRFNCYLESGKWAIDTVDCGEIIALSNELKIEVLSPMKAETAGKSVSPNASSMVLLVEHREVQILLTADIDAEHEKWLIQRYGDKLKSQVLKAAHHASETGNCAEFLEVVRPEIIVVMVGPSKWGYPAETTMQRLKAHCSKVLRTDEVGSVILESDGRSVKIISPGEGEP